MVGLAIRSPMKCSTKRSNAQTNQLQPQPFLLKIASDINHQLIDAEAACEKHGD